MKRARPSLLPKASKLGDILPNPDYLDAYEVETARPGQSIVETYAGVLGHLPAVAKFLMYARTPLVAPFGVAGVRPGDLARPIDTSKPYKAGDRIGRWKIASLTPDEIIAGTDDRHLDFRVSMVRSAALGRPSVIFSTAVVTHNLFGRVYLASILPFHRFGVPWLMSNAARARRI